VDSLRNPPPAADLAAREAQPTRAAAKPSKWEATTAALVGALRKLPAAASGGLSKAGAHAIEPGLQTRPRAMIHLEGVSKVYGEGPTRVEALRSVSLEIAAGEFTSIMGPSGSGKSTLLNLVSALDVPSSGRIALDGHDIATLDDDALTLFRRRKIGLIFQLFNLLPTLNALDNVLLPVMLERKATAQDRARAEQLLTEVGLGARVRHRVHQLSGGELQRVAIARALILEPCLILADEPTGNLDSVTGGSILELLRTTCDSRGTTVVMVTHDERAARVGGRILSLRDGRIVDDERVSAEPRLAGVKT
jgi:putative ABC transport system ATP-binding protein